MAGAGRLRRPRQRILTRVIWSGVLGVGKLHRTVTRYSMKRMSSLRSWRSPSRLLLALVFVFAQAAAAAHEFAHVSQQHQGACALHVFADQLGKTVNSVSTPGIAAGVDSPIGYRLHAVRLSSIEPAYRVRAPPSFSRC